MATVGFISTQEATTQQTTPYGRYIWGGTYLQYSLSKYQVYAYTARRDLLLSEYQETQKVDKATDQAIDKATRATVTANTAIGRPPASDNNGKNRKTGIMPFVIELNCF